MAERMVTLMRYEDVDQAQYHRELLENAGIIAEVSNESLEENPYEVGEHPAGGSGRPPAGGAVLLLVPEDKALRAGEILEEGLDAQMGGNSSLL